MSSSASSVIPFPTSLSREESNYFDLVASMYYCQQCANKMLNEGDEKGFVLIASKTELSYSTRETNDPLKDKNCFSCCLSEHILFHPIEMIDLISSYCDRVNMHFLCEPISSSIQEMIRCRIVKDNNRHFLYLEKPTISLVSKLKLHNKLIEEYETAKNNFSSDKPIIVPPRLSSNYIGHAFNRASETITQKGEIFLLSAVAFKDRIYISADRPENLSEPLTTIEFNPDIVSEPHSINGIVQGQINYSYFNKPGGPRCLHVNIDELNFDNVNPIWNEHIYSYELPFDGVRITEKSKMNMRLIQTGTYASMKATVIQFGRVKHDRNEFILDFKYPLSPIQAFSIAMSTIYCKV